MAGIGTYIAHTARDLALDMLHPPDPTTDPEAAADWAARTATAIELGRMGRPGGQFIAPNALKAFIRLQRGRSVEDIQLKDLYDAAHAQLGAEWNVLKQPYPRPIFRPRFRSVTADASAPIPDQRPSQEARADVTIPPWPTPNATSQAPPWPTSGTTGLG
jgi:hypothetical protein